MQTDGSRVSLPAIDSSLRQWFDSDYRSTEKILMVSMLKAFRGGRRKAALEGCGPRQPKSACRISQRF
jgi:hypothetical protein